MKVACWERGKERDGRMVGLVEPSSLDPYPQLWASWPATEAVLILHQPKGCCRIK